MRDECMRSVVLFASILASCAWSDHLSEIKSIAHRVGEADAYLRDPGLLVTMGNSPLDSAKLVFLPEVHDDPKSLLTQLLLIAREKKRAKPFILLDESLASMKKSMWDIFSEKA